jgi:hypothetical protein
LKAAGLLLSLGCLSLAGLHFVYGAKSEEGVGVAPQGPRCARGSEEWHVYNADPGHVWNRLHRSLYLRTARDGREYGRDELDPLLWGTTRHLLNGESYAQASACLDEFLDTRAERLSTDPLRRAMLQRDLWAVFDWTAQRSHSRAPEVHELRRRLAAAIRRLALSPAQINSLPDTYAAATASGTFAPDFDPRDPETPFLPSDLCRTGGPWVQLGVGGGEAVAPSHVAGFDGRSVFRAFISLPQGRAATLAYLKEAADFKRPWVRDRRRGADPRPNPRLPQFPTGTRLALVRQMLVIDERGKPTPTVVVESVQVRLHRTIPRDIPEAFDSGKDLARDTLAVCEFRLSRARLFAGAAGGLRAVARDEREFPLFQSHGDDLFELQTEAGESLDRHLRPVLGSCTACHFRPGIHSVLTRLPDMLRLRLRDVRRDLLPATDYAQEADNTAKWKLRQESWRLLRELWERVEKQ